MRKITQKCKSVTRLLTPLVLALALSACETTLTAPARPLYDITAPALESSQFYLAKVASSEGNKKADLYLLALKALIAEKKYNDATQLVIRLAKMPLIPIQLSEWQLNRANLLQKTGKPQAALDNLNFKPTWQLPPNQYKRYFFLSANLYQQTGNAPAMLMSLAVATPYISNDAEKEQNYNRIWNILDKMSVTDQNILLANGNQLLKSWVLLIKQLRRYASNPVEQQKALQIWLAENPSHPARQYLPEKLSLLQEMEIRRPEKIAVLLPLSDKFSAQGEAIRNGIIQKMLDDKSDKKPATLKFYDTNAMAMPDILSALEKDRVQFVIGPLQKGKVEEYVRLSKNAFPTLAMNIPKKDEQNESTACFFTLSPEQEAEQAAQHIAQKNHRFPLVIAPENEFGRRISNAFSKQWEREKGEKPEIALFKNHASMQKTIQKAFNLTQSQTRINQINQVVKLKMKAEQRSRRDIDAVYLIASADELTLLKPFIEVAINPDVNPPELYASSRANNRIRGVGELGELRDIEFTDVPLIVTPNSLASRKYHKIWPNQTNNIARLYALGMDAYSLIEALPQMKVTSQYRLNAESGELSLGQNCTINRTLSWAKFEKNGFIPVE